MAEGTDCAICTVRPAAFSFPTSVCRECRAGMANVVLFAGAETIQEIWKIGPSFSNKRERSRRSGSTHSAEVVASVAWGLLEQGLLDDALVTAAEAIAIGESADLNHVGASALEVLFDARLQQGEFLERLRRALENKFRPSV